MGMMKQALEATEIEPLLLKEFSSGQMMSDVAELTGMGFSETVSHEDATVLVVLYDEFNQVMDAVYMNQSKKGGA